MPCLSTAKPIINGFILQKLEEFEYLPFIIYIYEFKQEKTENTQGCRQNFWCKVTKLNITCILLVARNVSKLEEIAVFVLKLVVVVTLLVFNFTSLGFSVRLRTNYMILHRYSFYKLKFSEKNISVMAKQKNFLEVNKPCCFGISVK